MRSLYSWWEGFGSSYLAWVSIVVLFPPLHVRCPLGFSSWGCPGGLGFAPVRARCGSGTAAWVTGVLAVPDPQGVGSQGRRKYSTLEGHGNQNWPIRSSILAWRTPSLTEKPGRPQSTGLQRVGQDFFFWPVASLPQWELNVKVVQLLGLQGPWRCQVFRYTNCLRSRNFSSIKVFFWASVAGDQKASLASLSP